MQTIQAAIETAEKEFARVNFRLAELNSEVEHLNLRSQYYLGAIDALKELLEQSDAPGAVTNVATVRPVEPPPAPALPAPSTPAPRTLSMHPRAIQAREQRRLKREQQAAPAGTSEPKN